MTLGELLGPEAKLSAGVAALSISGIAADSRQVKPGYLFAALPGVNTDGARYAADAVARGAVAVLAPNEMDVDVPVVPVPDPRKTLAMAAAKFYGAQPGTTVAVTGTNGKTSVAAFTRQLWSDAGYAAASLGTVGVVSPRGTKTLKHTTPDPIELHGLLAELSAEGVTHLALEASSHGLQQRRLDGVALEAAAFTNISRDHLDYHASFEDYFAQKLRLFTELLQPGATAVIDMDGSESARVADAARVRGLKVFTVGHAGEGLRLVSAEIDGFAQRLAIEYEGTTYTVRLPLVGAFQASNALVAAGLVMATGASAADVLPRLERLQGATGRLDLAGTSAYGAPIFIDYAHTPDALAKALDALRPYAANKLFVVFGCGGDRDRGKRPEMGATAAEKADVVIVTDDNPRSEDPAAIRDEILVAVPGGREIGDRATAISEAIRMLREGDVLLVAGKGHETGQTIGTTVIPFSDHDAVAAALTKGARLG
ncbi:MAG: UDP-N-acetylmuramoyl-L-alanyl-D-glutamate--2,6-diaminopimelate ligase [Methyloceanibacter sp.]|nr:UDP-N-acetylmuramoyl-L-alanyl-D-glutamate--2,6-diaminopimelate ligase [Methyloceanibacter sp.]